MRPKVGVLLVNWNGRRYLERFLPALAATDYPDFEIVVWDNASSDDSVEWIKKHFPRVRVLTAARNWGFAGGNNRAVEQIDAPLIALVNTDVETPPQWLEPL
ncbi:MAG: glycosyltransferase, partial [Bacteroidia bacterium]|nr:glycosyltransferase [Bacteroidia bacterium]